MKKLGLQTFLLFSFLALFVVCARSVPDRNEIIFITIPYSDPSLNPEPSKDVNNIITRAVHRLADDAHLERHPVRSFLYDPSLQLTIVFDNPGTVAGAKVVDYSEIHINSERDFSYYLVTLAHEIIHLGVLEKYGNPANFSFLPPEDYAFLNLMEEAFAGTLGSWVQLTYPEVPNNYELRSWRLQNDYARKTEAMRNDFMALYPEYDLEQIIDELMAELFNAYMTEVGVYTMVEIPRNMAIVYSGRNTHIIPEYKVYHENSDAFLYHVWNYLESIMPFQLPENLSFDHYRSQFMYNVRVWAGAARREENSIFYWINFDAEAHAEARLSTIPVDERVYDYLRGEDYERLNRVMQEISMASVIDTHGSEFVSDIPAISENVIDYTDESAARQFSEGEEWGMLDLIRHEVHLIDGELNVNFWFSESASTYQIDRARSFTIRTFVLRRPYTIGGQPYDRMVRNMRINWDTLSSKVYLDGELMYHDRYDENNIPIR